MAVVHAKNRLLQSEYFRPDFFSCHFLKIYGNLIWTNRCSDEFRF